MAPRSREESEATRAASRARILAAARSLFADRGFVACRVADVAAAAGMSAGNVYWHFDSKEAILGAILADGFDERRGHDRRGGGRLRPRPPQAGPPGRPDARALRRQGRVHGHPRRADGARRPGAHPLPGLRHARDRRPLPREPAEGLRRGTIGGRGRPEDPELLVAFYFAFFNGLLITYADLWPALPREALRAAALRLVGYRPAG